ncbi:hypothetical protein HAX54_006398, partial [Datura stramonium]|nr:hypothetical protein [Datura stramonium]
VQGKCMSKNTLFSEPPHCLHVTEGNIRGEPLDMEMCKNANTENSTGPHLVRVMDLFLRDSLRDTLR